MSILVILCFAGAIVLMAIAVWLKHVPVLPGLAVIAFFGAVALVSGFHL